MKNKSARQIQNKQLAKHTHFVGNRKQKYKRANTGEQTQEAGRD